MVEARWTSRAATCLLGCLLLAVLGPLGTEPAQAVGAQGVVPRAHGLGRHPGQRDPSTDQEPLRITIDDLTPGVLPRRGPIRVSGTLTNQDTETWRDVHLYPYLDTDQCVGDGTCSAPMHSAAELAQAMKVDPASPVGERITDPNVRQTIASIAPGQSVSFLLTLPQRILREKIANPQPGVYWFGVHAIGDSDSTPHDSYADGRVLTFLPYLPPRYGTGPRASTTRLDTAIVAPLRAPIRHLRDGRLASPAAWLRALSAEGSLGGPLGTGAASGSHPVTWLVDPAVPDAVDQLARGNPPRLTPAPGSRDTASASPSTTGFDGGTSGSGSGGPLATAAASWLKQAHQALASGELLTLPYGDTELTGSDLTRGLYSASRAQPSLLKDWKLVGRRTIASPDGYVDPTGLARAHDSSLVLLGDRMLPSTVSPNRDGARVGAHPVVVASTGAGEGSPTAGDQYGTVSVRQRILSEAAVRLASGDTTPMVVQLPQAMGSGGSATFWSGLDQTWLHLTTVGSIADAAGTDLDPSSLHFPDSERTDQMPSDAQDAAVQLSSAGDLLDSVVNPRSPHDPQTEPTADDDDKQGGAAADANAGLAPAVTGEALSGTSYSLRGDQDAEARLIRSRLWLTDQLAEVSIAAPPGVTLSSAAGSFAVTITNGLDVPVTVAVAAKADGARLKKTSPVHLAARSRASVRLDVHSSRPGVHNVRLTLTNSTGAPIDGTVSVPVRSGSVGVVIWVILALGAGILFFAIAVRLVRRLRPRRDSGAAA